MSTGADVDIASLGLAVDATQVDAAAKSLDNLSAAGERNATILKGQRLNMEGVEASMKKQAVAADVVSDKVQRLLAKYDPLGVKLRSLESDFIALDKAVRANAVGSTSDAALDKTYKALNDEISKTRGLMDQAADTTTKFRISASYASRELIVMGHEAMSGNFSHIPGTFMSLLSHSNALASGWLGLIGIIGAVSAELGIMIYLAESSARGLNTVQNALASTGKESAMTREHLEGVVSAMKAMPGMSHTMADESLAAIGKFSHIGGTLMEGIGLSISKFSLLTGEMAPDAAKKLAAAFNDPAKGAAHLSEEFNFLTAAQIGAIESMAQQGDRLGAQNALFKAYSGWLAGVTVHQTSLQTSFSNLGTAWDKFFEGANKGGRMHILLDDLAYMVTLLGRGLGYLKEADGRASRSSSGKIGGGAGVAPSEDATALMLNAKKLSDSTATHKKAELEANLALLRRADASYIKNGVGPGATDDTVAAAYEQSLDRAEKEREIRKEIANINRTMGQDARQIAEARIAAELKLNEITIGLAQEKNDAALKMGQQSQQEHDKTATFLNLYKNTLEQTAARQQLTLGGLTALEKIRLQLTLERLAAERVVIDAKGVDAEAEHLKKYYDEAKKGVEDLGRREIETLDKTLAAQKLHNAEIGKTADEKELAKQAAQAAGTAQLQLEADAIRAAIEETGMAQEFADIYNARAAALDLEIVKRKELAELMGQAAVLEKQAAATKRLTDDWKRLTDDIERALTDALVKGFDSGKDAATVFKDSLKTILKTFVMKVVVQAVIDSAMNIAKGAVSNALGLGNSSSGGSAGGGSSVGVTDAFSMANMLANGNAGYSTAVWNAMNSSGGQLLGLSKTIGVDQLGNAVNVMTEAGQALSSALPYANAIYQLAQGNIGTAATSAIGTYIGTAIGGPIGGFIGGTLGSMVGGMFGGGGDDPHNNPQARGYYLGLGKSGVVGDSAGGPPLSSVMGPTSGAGWWGENTSLSSAEIAAINKRTTAAFASGHALAKALGLSETGIDSVRVNSASSGSFAQGGAGAVGPYFSSIDDAFTKLGEAMVKRILPSINDFKQAGETLTQTMQRLVTEFQLADQIVRIMGRDATAIFGTGTAGIKARNDLITKLGPNAAGLMSSYNQNYYSDAERLKQSTDQVNGTLLALGVRVLPQTRDQFRSLVEAQNLATDSGRSMFAALMSVADAFASITVSADAAAASIDQNKYANVYDYNFARLTGGKIPSFAGGTDSFGGGLRVVGEDGPELEFTGPSSIVSNSASKQLLDNGATRSEIAALRNDMRHSQAAIAAALMAFERRTRKWDNDGMPAVRTTA